MAGFRDYCNREAVALSLNPVTELNQNFQIKSQEEDFPEHTRQFELNIKLRNWNDEFPIFNSSEYTIDVLETTEANQILTAITATDRDIDDEVV